MQIQNWEIDLFCAIYQAQHKIIKDIYTEHISQKNDGWEFITKKLNDPTFGIYKWIAFRPDSFQDLYTFNHLCILGYVGEENIPPKHMYDFFLDNLDHKDYLTMILLRDLGAPECQIVLEIVDLKQHTSIDPSIPNSFTDVTLKASSPISPINQSQ